MSGLSPARQALAAAIGARAAAQERLERVRAGRGKSWSLVARAEDAIEDATRALAAAREAESGRLAAELVGDAVPAGPTIAEAEADLAKAKRERDAAERARDQLAGRDGLAGSDLRTAEFKLREAIGAVLADEGCIEALLTRYEEALDLATDLRSILWALPGRSQRQMDRGQVTQRDGTGRGRAEFEACLTALETDPTAPIPDLGVLDAEHEPAAKAA